MGSACVGPKSSRRSELKHKLVGSGIEIKSRYRVREWIEKRLRILVTSNTGGSRGGEAPSGTLKDCVVMEVRGRELHEKKEKRVGHQAKYCWDAKLVKT